MFRSLLILLVTAISALAADRKPNLVFIMADDLGYGELGCFGSKLIQTPRIDQMAAEGMRLTQFYAGNTVCAPSRSVLMTGLHMGHTRVRGNAGKNNPLPQTLRPEDVTVAEMLKKDGYATALFGKWGLGELGSGGEPTKQGFDTFFGYLNQHHAHNYYPAFLIKNDAKFPLKNVVPDAKGEPSEFGIGEASEKREYSHDLIMAEAMKWIDAHRSEPFFLYLSLTLPHANNEAERLSGHGSEVPDLGPYADKDWPENNKAHAAMITRMDADVGRLLDQLKALGLDENTLVIFTSDNGPHKEGGNSVEFFDSNGPLRGVKRDLYEGGIRVPTVARWPGKIKAGSESGTALYFGDLMATAAALTGAQVPPNLDSINFLPTLLGQPDEQKKHAVLYWEFHERGFDQAVLMDDRWKGVRKQRRDAPIELYDLETDLGEKNDVAEMNPEIVARAGELLVSEHVDSEDWPIKDAAVKKGPKAAVKK